MKCLRCGCTEDKVIDTRIAREGEAIRRRRECLRCGNRFTTYEAILRTEAVVVKRDGTREDFDPDKLWKGIRHACWKRPVSETQIDQAVRNISNNLNQAQEREVSSHYIGELAMNELRRLDHVAYVRFASVYRRFEDIGQFVNEIKSLTDNSTEQISAEKSATDND